MSREKFSDSEVFFIVKRAMEAFGCKRKKDLANLFGILPQDMTGRIKRGTIVNLIEKEAYKRNVNFDYILTGEGEQYADSPLADDILETKQIPILGTVPAGFPEMPPGEDEIIDYLYFPDVPKQAFAIIVKGESMSPTVRDGDYAISIKAGKFDVKNGDLIIARNEWNELLLKRYREKDDRILLTSDNPEYKPVTPNKHYKIVGKVIRIVRDIKF